MRWFEKVSFAVVVLMAFFIPIEHKYDKPWRNFALLCVPEHLSLASYFDPNIYLYPSDVLALFLLICILFAYKTSWRPLFLTHGTICLWILFFSALYSILASPMAHYLTVYTRLIQLLTPILLATFLIHSPKNEKRTHYILASLVLAALFQSSVALCQYFSQDYLGLRLLSECREPPAIVFINSGRRWLFDLFSNTAPTWTVLRRSAGTFPHCNALGGFLMLSILISYSYLVNAIRDKKRYAIALLIALQFFALATTYSRSAILGLVLGSSLWLFWGWRTKTPCRFLTITIAFSAICSFGLLFEQYLERGGIFNYSEAAQKSDQVRLSAQQIAFKMIQDNPLTGVGFQQFSRAAQNYGNPTGVHNIYLFLAVEMGLIASLAFLGFIGFVLLSALSIPWTPQITSLFTALIAFLFIGLCDFYPILFQQGKLMLFFTAALLLAETLRIKQKNDYKSLFSLQSQTLKGCACVGLKK